MLVKCDVVKCRYNKNCTCVARVAEITLTHDETSKKEYIECKTCVIKA